MLAFDVSRSKEIVYDALEKIRFHNLNKVFFDVTEVKGLDEAKDSIMKMFILVPMITRFLPKGTKTSFLGTEKQVSKYNFFDDMLPCLGLFNTGMPWIMLRSSSSPWSNLSNRKPAGNSMRTGCTR